VSGENVCFVETNTLVKTDFEKLENSQSYKEMFGQVLQTFYFSLYNSTEKFFNFFYNVPNKIQVFAFNLNPVS
jgi:hypothetical protein